MPPLATHGLEAVNFGVEAPFFDLFDGSTGETLDTAGSFAVRLFMTPFSLSFGIESLYSTCSESFCLISFLFFFHPKIVARLAFVGRGR